MLPKIIHSIWLGSKPLPDDGVKYLDSWRKHHKDYELILWDDNKAEQFMTSSAFDGIYRKSDWVGLKSDILRYEILHKIGGVYVDADFECFKSVDDIVSRHKFVYGDQDSNDAAIGFLSAHVRCPFLSYFLPILKCHLQYGQHGLNNFTGTLERTGPFFFQNCLSAWYGLDKQETSVFDNDNNRIGTERKGILRLFEWTVYPYNPYKGRPGFNKINHPNAYAAHHWWASWK